ncbi:hypothetical protein F5Y02DRAFT_223587 [Annulohypoxylon stygium]|nr:hypothetical protein F5Y02DRAFT_223587 [Annulohypoxylon stygium]
MNNAAREWYPRYASRLGSQDMHNGNGPFIGMSAKEIADRFQRAPRFVILDEQSGSDMTAVIVERDCVGNIHTFRVTFEATQLALCSLSEDIARIKELQDRAASQEGVLSISACGYTLEDQPAQP